MPNSVEALISEHRPTLERAREAIRSREYFSQFPESIKAQPEGATEAGKAAYEAHLGRRFELDQAGTVGWVGAERSPYGRRWGSATRRRPGRAAARRAGRDAGLAGRGPEVRAAVCVEIVTPDQRAQLRDRERGACTPAGRRS